MNSTLPDLSQAARPGLLRRLSAIFYDAILVISLMVAAFALAYLPLAMGLGIEDLRDHPLLRTLLFIWMTGVGVGFHLWFWTHGGQTLGMRAWRLKLLAESGESVTWQQAAVRYLVAILSWLALGLGFLWLLVDPEKRTWHDIASGTRLVLVDPNAT